MLYGQSISRAVIVKVKQFFVIKFLRSYTWTSTISIITFTAFSCVPYPFTSGNFIISCKHEPMVLIVP